MRNQRLLHEFYISLQVSQTSYCHYIARPHTQYKSQSDPYTDIDKQLDFHSKIRAHRAFHKPTCTNASTSLKLDACKS